MVERTFAWIYQFRRLTIRCERHAALSPFLVLAAALNIIAASVVMLLARNGLPPLAVLLFVVAAVLLIIALVQLESRDHTAGREESRPPHQLRNDGFWREARDSGPQSPIWSPKQPHMDLPCFNDGP
ncbi:hypothetical protein MAXJ12_30612 [Mesorhizobium alhagi CCNWXJ12-2]|uniref:Uncharacterized protein n=1 Tax=Mesorhizobium alhagi CCNWXJ12-2 TaxID=1107882 RepID=H0I0Y5_9HYPH|nr:hypothetical protein MAXJ12_30612 [Mesorhizobium alhagi CCNWXJ12-2]